MKKYKYSKHTELKRLHVLLTIILFFLLAACSQSLSYSDIVDGPDGKELELNPSEAQLVCSESLLLEVTGGVPPYSLNLPSPLGGEDEKLDNGYYTAPSDQTGNVLIQVVDSYGASSMAEITVVSQAGSVPLSLSPSSISLYKGKSVTLEATGGTGEYSFTLEQAIGGTGELLIDSSYTAPSDTGGTALIRVTDELGDTADASVSVSFTTPSVPDVNYGSLSIVHTGSTLGGGNINGSFSFSNDGSDDGSQSISWIVYYSEDTSIGSGDTIVSQGELGALNQGEGSGDISFSGTWPYAATDTTYYLIAELSAEDDISSSNDTGSVAVDLEAVIAKNIDYDIQELSLITPSTDVKYYQISFHIHNIGGDDGEDYVSWGAYYSEDDNWDEGDINFANGTLDILIDGSSSEYTQFEDTAWSYPAGTYYIIIKISADEDINETNNYESTGPYTVE